MKKEQKEAVVKPILASAQQDMYGAILHKVTHVSLKAYCGFCRHRHQAGGCSIVLKHRAFTDPACIKFSEKAEDEDA